MRTNRKRITGKATKHIQSNGRPGIRIDVHRWLENNRGEVPIFDGLPALGYQYQIAMQGTLYFSTLRVKDFESFELQAKKGYELHFLELIHMSDQFASRLERILRTTKAMPWIEGIEKNCVHVLMTQGSIGNFEVVKVLTNYFMDKGLSLEQIDFYLDDLSAPQLLTEDELTGLKAAIKEISIIRLHDKLQSKLQTQPTNADRVKI